MHCHVCNQEKARRDFSNNQLKKKSTERRCKTCTGMADETKICETSKKPEAEHTDPFKTLLIWLKENGAIFPSLMIKKHSEIYRSVVTNTRIPSDSLILQVPRKCIMTTIDAKECRIAKEMEEAGFRPKSIHTWLAFYLLEERRSKVSEFKPYIDILPKHYRNFPSFYSSDELAKMQGSFSLDMLDQRQAALEEEFNRFTSSLPKYKNIYKLEDFIWARIVVITRVFGFKLDDKNSTEGLVPMADMLNHRQPPGTSWQFELSKNAFTIRTTKMFLKGGEIFDTYGSKCNSRYLINYGFTLSDNQNNNQATIFIDPNAISESITDERKKTVKVKRLLFGKPRSYDDGYSGYQAKIDEGKESKVSQEGQFRFQFSIIPDTDFWDTSIGDAQGKLCATHCIRACMSLLRLLLCTKEELATLCTSMDKQIIPLFNHIEDEKQKQAVHHMLYNQIFVHVHFEPPSAQTELFVLRFLARACRSRLAEFNSDLETDKKRRDSSEPMSNDYNIYNLLISEKEVLTWYIALEEFVRKSWKKHKNVYNVNRDIRKNSKFRSYSRMYWSKLIGVG